MLKKSSNLIFPIIKTKNGFGNDGVYEMGFREDGFTHLNMRNDGFLLKTANLKMMAMVFFLKNPSFPIIPKPFPIQDGFSYPSSNL